MLNVLGAEQIGRALIEFGQRVNETNVSVDGALGLAVEREILNEFLA